jgi:hypothetical protein
VGSTLATFEHVTRAWERIAASAWT